MCSHSTAVFVLEPQKQLGRGLCSPVVSRRLLQCNGTCPLSGFTVEELIGLTSTFTALARATAVYEITDSMENLDL